MIARRGPADRGLKPLIDAPVADTQAAVADDQVVIVLKALDCRCSLPEQAALRIEQSHHATRQASVLVEITEEGNLPSPVVSLEDTHLMGQTAANNVEWCDDAWISLVERCPGHVALNAQHEVLDGGLMGVRLHLQTGH